MSDNQKKLNEQLVKVVLDTKTCDEVRIKRAKYLIRLGANANQKVNGKSLLKIAREKGYKEIEEVIKESLRKSFDELLEGDKFERVLEDCEYANGHKVVVSKEKAIDLGKQFWDKNGNLKSAKEIEDLILQGADVDVQVNKDKTALMIASYFGREDVVRILLGAGADVNIKGDDGWTALTWAAKKGHKEIVEMLLDGGANVNQKDNRGSTALMEVTEKGYKEIVQLLLENGADVNAQENDGWAALMWASARGRLDVVNILLEGGADVNVQNKYGSTALMMASGPFKNAIIKEIEEHIQKTEEKANNVDIPKTEEKVNNGGGFWGKIFGGLTR